jgi:predicted CXXCH cytochrome family protein
MAERPKQTPPRGGEKNRRIEMKGIKASLMLAAAALLLSSPAMAFHSGGVAECEGCHTMHNSLDGDTMTGKNSEGLNTAGSTAALPVGQAAKYLLRGTDQSSTCLNCHGDPSPGGYHISTPMAASTSVAANIPVQYTPGGDFAWLKKTFSWTNSTSDAAALIEEGSEHGHNIIAADFGYLQEDAVGKQSSPNGGAGFYPAASFHCSSCHDPHGRYRRTTDAADPGATGTAALYTTTGAPIFASGSYGATVAGAYGGYTNLAVGAYRILGGIGYVPKSTPGFAFTKNPPTAVAPSSYNVSESVSQLRVAYGKGMSEWCSNCHQGMHTDAYASGQTGAGTVHPAGNAVKLSQGTAGIDAIYNSYKMSGNLTGTIGNAYNTLVPFETQDTDIATLAAKSGTIIPGIGQGTGAAAGADANSTVMCLSCHRAHASGFPSMLRFQTENEFAMVSDSAGVAMYPGTDNAYSKTRTNRGRAVAEYQAAYYFRPASDFAPWQRDLCNKCHAKD